MGSPKLETPVHLLASFALFTVLLLIIPQGAVPAYASTLEAQALLKWKSSLQNQNQSTSSLSSWTLPPQNATGSNATAASPCGWYGIACNLARSVIGINLTSSNIRGTLDEFPFSSLPYLTYIDMYINELSGGIPPQVGLLTNLTYLDLSFNQLSGQIPRDIGDLTKLEVLHLISNELNGSIPDEIGRLRLMNELALYSNQLDGSLPSSLGNLSSLARLYLYNNSFSGFIPLEMGNLTNLEEIYMDTNFLTGPLPPTFGKLTKLTELHVYDNELTGSIPPEIGNLNLLRRLSLYYNNLTGSIPSTLGNLTELTLLFLYGNQLSGIIPDELGNLQAMIDFELSMNQLTGPVPSSLGNMTDLKYLFLRENQLSGSVPGFLGDLTNLVVLQLDTNQFTDFMPDNLCRGGSLRNLTMAGNNLTGSIPRSLRNCTSLLRVRLEENQLTGNLSDVFGVYPNLDFMDLSFNKFYGEISVNWGSCPRLRDLRIAGNNMTGTLPPEIGNATELQGLDLSSIGLVGEIPKELGKLTSLVRLNLSRNQLSGMSPDFVSLSGLQRVDLSRNRLSMSIPERIGQLADLVLLDLSNNRLSQEIPGQIGMLTHLSELDLNNNSLIGEIPAQLSNLQSLVKLDLSHNSLSGPIYAVFKDMPGLATVDISYNEFQGPVPNTTAFQDAPTEALQGNAGLCGNVDGLQPCDQSAPLKKKKNSNTDKKVFLIVFLILGAFILFSFVGVYYIFHRRKNRRQAEPAREREKLVSISTYDGRILYEEIIEATENFNDRYCIGVGGYGRVFRAKLRSGVAVAVKKLHQMSDSGQTNQKEFQSEIRALTEIRHRNIVRLHGFCSHPQHSFLVYEYVERGDLSATLSEDGDAKELGWDRRANIVKGIAHALSYMHHDCVPPIVHRDISSNNILLDYECEARVSDFGTAKLLKLDTSNWSAVAGTYGYVAPELAYTMKVTEKCNVYSFGVVAIEVIHGKHPGETISSLLAASDKEIATILKNMLDSRLPAPMPGLQDELLVIFKLAIACLSANPRLRPSMNMVSQMLSACSAAH
ncbi:MDIS1-interacting receptor like kinase 2-like [Rhodamnia argentea]|uniref:non-specific serine/threonine protein kinase n=1 Tax=Rhodamnia argentea TaxID=178133 RepID=A0A8B8Q307_9MYRT|nr:MDIS1-interacting receptor like kinase 2-like [Rhodamnia argentea]